VVDLVEEEMEVEQELDQLELVTLAVAVVAVVETLALVITEQVEMVDQV
jgi:hypothetical protein